MSVQTSPKISILMGVYNADQTLEKAIESIVQQEFKDWEFIIIDDGSRDRSYEILKHYTQDPRFKIFQNEKNVGLAETLNRCFSHAKGDFLARQDADDYSAPDRLSRQLAFLEQHPEIDVLGTDAHLINNQGTIWGEIGYHKKPTMKDWVIRSQMIHPTIMMKSSVLKAAKGYDPKAIRVEDYELWFRLLSHKVCFQNLKEKLYYFHWSDVDYQRKRFRDRLSEAKMRFKGMRLNSVPLWDYRYALKPLIIALIPDRLLHLIHKIKFRLKI